VKQIYCLHGEPLTIKLNCQMVQRSILGYESRATNMGCKREGRLLLLTLMVELNLGRMIICAR
jgi:hypothetical protein